MTTMNYGCLQPNLYDQITECRNFKALSFSAPCFRCKKKHYFNYVVAIEIQCVVGSIKLLRKCNLVEFHRIVDLLIKFNLR